MRSARVFQRARSGIVCLQELRKRSLERASRRWLSKQQRDLQRRRHDIGVVNASAGSITYSLQNGAAGEDGFDFNVSSGGSVCLDLASPGNVPVYLGASHVQISTPLDLTTLGSCSGGGSPTLAVQPLAVSENDGTADVQVTLSPAASGTVTVNFSTLSGSAVAGQDFNGKFQALTFTPGQTSKTVSVNLINDTVTEPVETFTGRIFGAAGATIGTATALVTINDDDSGVATLDVQPLTVNENDGTAVVEVKLTPAATSTVTVQYSTNAGSAVGGQDYFGTTGTLTFNPGDTSKTYPVTLINDTTPESQESFTARIFNPSGATMGANTAPVTINDDDSGASGLADGDGRSGLLRHVRDTDVYAGTDVQDVQCDDRQRHRG